MIKLFLIILTTLISSIIYGQVDLPIYDPFTKTGYQLEVAEIVENECLVGNVKSVIKLDTNNVILRIEFDQGLKLKTFEQYLEIDSGFLESKSIYHGNLLKEKVNYFVSGDSTYHKYYYNQQKLEHSVGEGEVIHIFKYDDLQRLKNHKGDGYISDFEEVYEYPNDSISWKYTMFNGNLSEVLKRIKTEKLEIINSYVPRGLEYPILEEEKLTLWKSYLKRFDTNQNLIEYKNFTFDQGKQNNAYLNLMEYSKDNLINRINININEKGDSIVSKICYNYDKLGVLEKIVSENNSRLQTTFVYSDECHKVISNPNPFNIRYIFDNEGNWIEKQIWFTKDQDRMERHLNKVYRLNYPKHKRIMLERRFITYYD
jgi:hypothetical protein